MLACKGKKGNPYQHSETIGDDTFGKISMFFSSVPPLLSLRCGDIDSRMRYGCFFCRTCHPGITLSLCGKFSFFFSCGGPEEGPY